VGADLLGMTAAVVVLLVLGVGVELFFWFPMIAQDDEDAVPVAHQHDQVTIPVADDVLDRHVASLAGALTRLVYPIGEGPRSIPESQAGSSHTLADFVTMPWSGARRSGSR